MKLFKRGLCLILALLMLVSLAACADKGGDGESNDSVSTIGDWEIDFSDKDYEGYEFTVLRSKIEEGHGWMGIPIDLGVDEMSGDILSNAVYNRNQTLSELLNVTIKLEMVETGDKYTSTLNTSVMSGDGGYDLSVLHMRGFPTLINQGLVKDMNELELDTSYSWWDKEAEEALNIAGKQFAMISDITYVDKLATIGVFYNTSMAEELQLPNLYDMVDNGEWTLEKMKEYAVIATNSGEEVYGISSQNDFSYYMMHAANIQTVSKNNNGDLVYKLAYQRPVSMLQEVFSVMNEPYYFNRMHAGLDVAETVQMFNDQTLFLVRPLQTFYNLKDVSDNYGVLPMPKYDDVYEGYYSSVNHHAASLMAVPMTNNENERTADVLQAWGMASEKIVNPEFYDRILSTRMVNDVDSIRMLDIIFEHRTYDIGLIFMIGGVEGIVLISSKVQLEKAPGTIASSISSMKSSVEVGIKDFVDQIQGS